MDHHEVRSHHVNNAFSRSLPITKKIEGNSWKGIVRGKFYLVMENLWEYLQIKKLV